MNSEKNGTVCWYSNASPNSARTPVFSASAKTSVNKRLFPMPGGPSMTSTPPRPCATAAISAPITFSSPARPRIGGMRTFPDALAMLTRTAAPRREVGGRKTSPLCRSQFSSPLALVSQCRRFAPAHLLGIAFDRLLQRTRLGAHRGLLSDGAVALLPLVVNHPNAKSATWPRSF